MAYKLNMYKYLNEDMIDLVHEYLGTEKKQKILRAKILHMLDNSTRFVVSSINSFCDIKYSKTHPTECDKCNRPCEYCYINALENNNKLGVCNVCDYRNDKKMVPLNFKNFRKLPILQSWKILSTCGYEIFNEIIKGKPAFIDHPKRDIVYEIIYGPMEHRYTTEQFKTIQRLIRKFTIH